MRKIKNASLWFTLLVAIICMLFVSLVVVQKAKAAPFYRNEGYGYFNNEYDGNGDVVLTGGLVGVGNVDQLVARISSQLNSGTAHNKTGAAFLVLVMLGAPAGSPKGAASGLFPGWEKIVRQYAAAGRIDFGVQGSFASNTYWQDARDDVAWFTQNDTQPVIRFRAANGTTEVMIKISCGNIVGNVTPLHELDKKPTVTIIPSCTNRNIVFRFSDPDGGSMSVTYYVNNPSGTKIVNVTTTVASGGTKTVDMSGQDQSETYVIGAGTNGYDPSGGPGTPALDADEYGPCTTSTYDPQGNVLDANCSTQPRIRGWAYDRDRLESTIYVDIYMDGRRSGSNPGTLIHRGKASLSNVDGVDASKDGYQFNKEIYSYIDENEHDFYIYAEDIDSAGALTGKYTFIEAIYNDGPCNSEPIGNLTGSCSANINFTISDADHDNDIAVRIYKNMLRPDDGSGYVAAGTATGSGSTKTYNWAGTRSHDDYFSNTYYVYVPDYDYADTNLQTAGNEAHGFGWKKIDTVKFGPCAIPTCAISSSPADIEPGGSFTVTAKIDYTNGGSNGAVITPLFTLMKITVTDPNGTTLFSGSNAAIGWTTNIVPPGTGQGTTPIIAANSAGLYNYKVEVTSLLTLNCSNSITASNKPYVTVYGGNTVVSGGSSGECNVPATKSIYTSYDTANKKGSGTQFLATAPDLIVAFASALLRGSAYYPSPPGGDQYGIPPSGLTYANTATAPAFGVFGGASSEGHCQHNYWGKEDNSDKPPSTSASSINLASLSSGKYLYEPSTPGAAIEVTGSSLANGSKIALYIEGNVYISGNLTYQNTSWATEGDIPSLYIIAKGNIYIAPTVTQLDGVYIAQPNNPALDNASNGGRIYTCASSTGQYSPTTDQVNYVPGGPCSQNQLVVNGAFDAQKVLLLRTGSTLKKSLPGEHPAGASHNCDAFGGNKSVCSAEVFNLSPELFLSTPFPPTNTYQAITSMPPIL